MAVFSESARKTRPISIGKFKGNEFGLLTLSAMPTLSYFIIKSKKDEWCVVFQMFYIQNTFITYIFRKSKAKAVAVYSFLVRLYMHDDDVLERAVHILRQDHGLELKDLHKIFYEEFQDGFCSSSVRKMGPTINLHCFYHLEESRRRCGPLYRTSAEPFEAMYAVFQRCYQAGTTNTPKQILQNFYLRERLDLNPNVFYLTSNRFLFIFL